jgi:hypothetical protein
MQCWLPFAPNVHRSVAYCDTEHNNDASTIHSCADAADATSNAGATGCDTATNAAAVAIANSVANTAANTAADTGARADDAWSVQHQADSSRLRNDGLHILYAGPDGWSMYVESHDKHLHGAVRATVSHDHQLRLQRCRRPASVLPRWHAVHRQHIS